MGRPPLAANQLVGLVGWTMCVQEFQHEMRSYDHKAPVQS